MTAPHEAFVPSEAHQKAYRNLLGLFGTGVTIITTATPDGPVAMTANSFTSVSLDPPLILWSLAHSSSRFDAFADAPHFAIHFLAHNQLDLAARFARDGWDFHGVSWTAGLGGSPCLSDCLARLDCSLETTHEAGDHRMVLGRVHQVQQQSEDAPLFFYSGGYGTFSGSAA